MTGAEVAWLLLGWVAGVLTTGGALYIWSLVLDTRDQQ